MDVLQALVDGYNASYHRSIKMKPKDVRRTHQAIIRQRLYGVTKRHRKKPYKYDVGAWVRVSKQRLVFDKGYTPN